MTLLRCPFLGHCGYLGSVCACILFQHMTHISLGTPLLMGALVLHGNVSAISGNVSAISRVCGGMRSLGSGRPRQIASARFWKKWLRLGEGWLGRWITSVSSQPIVFRQSRLRALLPNETTPVPCAAAKPALARLRLCALSLGTLEQSADTVPTLTRRDASPTLTQRESATTSCRVSSRRFDTTQHPYA